MYLSPLKVTKDVLHIHRYEVFVKPVLWPLSDLLSEKTIVKALYFCYSSTMSKENVAAVRPGQKFMHKRNKTIYIVRNVKHQNVVLVSENGDTTMRIQLASLVSAAFEPIYD